LQKSFWAARKNGQKSHEKREREREKKKKERFMSPVFIKISQSRFRGVIFQIKEC